MPLSLLSAPLLLSSTPSSEATEQLVTSTPFAEASEACASGSALCEVVTSTTGSSKIGAWVELLVGLPLRILLIITVAVVLRWVLHKLIKRVVEQIATGGQGAGTRTAEDRRRTWFGERAASVVEASPLAMQRRSQRARTIGTVLRSVATTVISIVATLMVLSEVGLNIAPLLASAGIVGVAIGFGAQSLVKDFLSGMFMILDDQYGVGDLVNLGDAIGTVESVGLRVTQVRDVNGTLWYVPNGQIARVGNLSQGWSRALVDVTVAYGQDLAKASTVMKEQADLLHKDPEWSHLVLDEPEVWGVEQMSNAGVVLRVVVKTAPAQQANVARELRQRINVAFTRAGISFPFSSEGTEAGPKAIVTTPPEEA